jgi:glycosyltransferase involved in cell wall biosynthesis/peptidoglycan/xylan/chitin deacetylase (PgdA/CDA1 family)
MTELSIVIATFNRANDLRRCLDAIASQTAPPGTFEVVVVDDGSTDGTGEMLAGYTAPFRLRVERQPNRGQPAALNRGAAAAQGVHCLFLDDDIVADPELVDEHLRAQRDTGGVLALGKLRLRLVRSGGGLARYFAAWWESHYRRFDEGSREPDFWASYSGNLSAPTSAIRAAGGFDEELTRSFDVELAYRLERGGLRIVYLPQAGAEQRYAKGFRELVRDFDRAGSAAVLLWRRHPEVVGYPPLGDFAQGGTRAVLLRRLMLALRVPVWPLGVLDPLLARCPPARLYRFLQLYCFWRSLRSALDDRDTWRRLTRGTVILMYHALARSGEPASRYVMPVRRFRRQLSCLRLCRHPVLSLDEYVRHREERRLPPARSVVVTFDDGYTDTAEVALPLMRRGGVPATVFVVSGAMGDANRWTDSGPLAGRPLLSRDGVRDLVKTGTAVGAHTVSHASLTDVAGDRAEDEILASRARLEQELGAPVRHFAYPYGRTSEAIRDLVRRAGFASASGIQPGANGPAVPIHDLRRVEVAGTWSLLHFVLTVWLGRPLHEASRQSGP